MKFLIPFQEDKKTLKMANGNMICRRIDFTKDNNQGDEGSYNHRKCDHDLSVSRIGRIFHDSTSRLKRNYSLKPP